MSKTFKRVLGTVVAVVVVGAVVYGAGVTYDLHRSYPAPAAVADAGSKAQIERGKYVAYTADCAACHTAPKGGAPFAGGYPMNTPFGTILSSNITPDPDTGIGGWDFAMFDRAVRHGKGSHGYLYPAMPYTSYANMTDQDMQDLWAYIQSLPAQKNAVVENQLPFPANQRWLMGGWNLLFFHAPALPQPASQTAEIQRGQYLVTGPGHCSACHTSRDPFGAETADFLQGGQLGAWYAPNLTNAPVVGLGNWSADDITQYLKTGSNQYAVSSGPMTEAVENSTQHLTDADLHAIAAYLKALPAQGAGHAQVAAADAETLSTGKRVYESQCNACHVSNGEGVRRMIPAFAGSAVVNGNDPESLIRTVLLGEDGPMTAGNPTGAGMPAFDWRLSDEDLAAALTYMRQSWGNHAAPVSADAVRQERSKLKARNWVGAAQPAAQP